MATVVVYIKNKDGYSFFLGKESNFLHDTEPSVRSLEAHTFPPNTSVIQMRKHYREIAHTLSKEYGFRVQFDTPKQDPETHVAKVRFRILRKSSKYGFVKGGAEPSDEGDPRKTALREFQEECMDVNIPLEAFVESTTVSNERRTYYLDVTPFQTQLLKVMEAWKLTYYGELFETKFLSKKDICRVWNELNNITKLALQSFFKDFNISCKKGGHIQSSFRRGMRRTRSSR